MSTNIKIRWVDPTEVCPEKTSKLAVPGKWAQRPVSDVIGLFVSAYNGKAAEEHKLNVEELHLEDSEGEKIYSNAPVSTSLGDHSDYFLKRGRYIKEVVEAAVAGAGQLRCKNYGCQKFFIEEENEEGSCSHHVGPPIFHDTMKCWSCCRDRKAFDFEAFQLLPTCSTGRHSTVDPKIALGASPSATVFSSAGGGGGEEAAPVPLKSIAEYNLSNPTAVTAASSATQTVARKSTRAEDGVTARCQRKGCQKTFVIAENAPTACTYHKGNPVFHDAVKFWSCCSDKKCFEFDEFLAVPGCASGCHDDGIVELSDA